MSIRVAFVGYGGIAKAHQSSVVLSGMGQIVGGMDIDPKQRQRFEEEAGAPSFECYKEMFDKTKPNAVIVSTPPSVREDIIAECISRNLAVLTEKPLAHNAKSARKLFEMSKKAKSVCGVAYCWRFNPGVNRIKKLLTDGTLGLPIEFVIFFSGYVPWYNEAWRTDIGISGGGCLADNGSHALDIFRYVIGPVKNAAGITRHVWPGRGDDSAFILIAGEDGSAGQVTVSWMFPHGVNKIQLIGSEGSATYDLNAIDELQVCIGKDEVRTEKLSKEARFVDQMKAFLSAVQNGRKSQLATFEDGLAAAEIVENIYKNRL
ncbi:MAG: Gfo/Idh/MocA family oxidoreductase [Planctomycetota bacterium]